MKESLRARRTLSPEALRVRGWIVPGAIKRRGNCYYLVMYLGRENGRRMERWFPAGRSRVLAEALQQEMAVHTLAHSSGRGLNGSDRETFGAYLRDWLARRTGLAEKTRAWYDVMVAHVGRDPLGAVRLSRITPRALEAFYARVITSGRSSTTALHYHRLFHTALRDAARQDVVRQNVAAYARAPRRAKVRPDVWTEAQTRVFVAAARSSSPRLFPLYLFLIGTGARIGEACGLRWRDVNLTAGTATIAQALQRPNGGGFVLAGPKTETSVRTIALPADVVASLRELQAVQQAERAVRGVCAAGAGCRDQHCRAWHPLDLVFTQPTGKPHHANNLRLRDLYPLCRSLGLSWRRCFHGFRHGHGSYLVQRGVSVKVIQERLGHKDAAFTQRTYLHLLPGAQAQAVAATDAMLHDGGAAD